MEANNPLRREDRCEETQTTWRHYLQSPELYLHSTHNEGWVTLCVVALSGGWPDWAVARGQCSVRNSSSIAITSTGASFLVICIFLLLSGSAWFFSRTLLEAFHNSQLFPRLPCIRNASVNNNPSGATEWHGYDLTNFLLHNAMFKQGK